MSEKMSEVFREYNMNIEKSQRGRGAIILRTDKGIRQLKPLEETESRLAAEYLFKEKLFEEGFANIDRCVAAISGEMVTYDRYQNPYVMRIYFEGRELSMTSQEDIKDAIKNLAEFHLAGKKVYEKCKDSVHVRSANDFQKRNIELKRIKNYILKNKKREFELTYLREYDYFYDIAVKCEGIYREQLSDVIKKHLGYCHGTYDQHCILKTDKGLATINFNRFYAGNQIEDLYHFMRKALEKNKYNFNILALIIREYERYISLTEEDLKYLYILLTYPEKFYKISNQYMNSSKNWIPPKLYEKLYKEISDKSKKNDIIFGFKSYYSLHI